MAEDTTTNPPKASKDFIARAIVIFSFSVLIGLLVIACIRIGNETFPNMKDLITLILPVIGTWMGTILAFYFTKENFEAASKSMQQTISKLTSEEKLKTTKATSVMIPVNSIDHPFTGGATPDTLTIKDLLAFLDKVKRNRVVVMNDKKVVTQVIHRSLINDFISHQVFGDQTPDAVKAFKISDMAEKGSDNVKNTLRSSVEFISQEATLFDAQQKMINNKSCQDVFITPGGSSTEPIIGWISSSIITDNAKV